MKKEILKIVANPRILHASKQLQIAGIITDELAKHNVEAILVGGSAVEFYTRQLYVTQDIDFVLSINETVIECMKSLGFVNHDGVWECDQVPFIVKLHKRPLAGDMSRINNISIGGKRISVLSLEDTIINLYLRGKYWEDSHKNTDENYKECFFIDWAKLMLKVHLTRLDYKYFIQRILKENCENDILNYVKREKIMKRLINSPNFCGMSEIEKSKKRFLDLLYK